MKSSKLFVFSLFILCPYLLFSQSTFPINSTTNEVEYTGIESIENLNQDQIYKRAQLWMLSNLKSSDNLNDIISQKEYLIASGNIMLNKLLLLEKNKIYISNINLNFKLSFFIKDSKYKYKIENIIIHYDIINYYTSINAYSNQLYLENITSKLINLKCCGLVIDNSNTYTRQLKERKPEVDTILKERINASFKNLIAEFTTYIKETDELDW